MLLVRALILLCCLSCVASLSFTVDGGIYKAVFPEPGTNYSPEVKLFRNTDNPFHIFTIFPFKFLEIEVPEDIDDFSPADYSTEVYKAPVISSFENNNYTSTIFNETNALGMRYVTTFPNGASVSFNYTTNQIEEKNVLIPRTKDCGGAENNCTCKQYHTIKINSLEMSLDVYNWPFAPPQENKTNRFVLDLKVIGQWDLEAYAGDIDTEFSEMLVFNTCDVMSTVFRLTEFYIPISFLSNAYTDGIPSPIQVVTDKKIHDVVEDGYVLSFRMIFQNFSNSMSYDPDMNVLLAGEGTGTDTDRTDSDDSFTSTIILAVVIPVSTVLLITIVVTAVIIVIATKKKKIVKARGAILL
jgi:hypothetical protein